MKSFSKIKTYERILLLILSFALSCTVSMISVFAQNSLEKDTSAISPKSLFTVGNGITIEENYDLPSYMTNGYILRSANDGEIVDRSYFSEGEVNGIKVSSRSEANKVEFNNVINVDGFTKDDVLFEFAPLSSFRVASADFEGMKVWVTDADNEDIWFCVDFWAVDAQFGGATRMCVTLSNGASAAYRWGAYHDTISTLYEGGRRDFYSAFYSTAVNNGLGINCLYDAIYRPISIRYDQEDKSVWITNIFENDYKCILDLDHTEAVGFGNEFPGFTNNRVKIAFQTYDLGGTAEYAILNIGNNTFNGTSVVDTTVPDYVDWLPNNGIPTGAVGKNYPLFKGEFYDNYSGVLPYSVFVKTPSNNDFTLLDGLFIPQETGNYVIRYSATDLAGNSRVIDYNVFAKYGISSINLSLSETETTNYSVGDVIQVPTVLSLTGGTGPLSCNYTIERLSDGAEIKATNDSFVPYLSGEYLVTYTATDYVGNQTHKTLKYVVSDNNLPVYANELNIHKKFVSGVKVVLPEVQVYDYNSVLGQRLIANTTVTATSVSDPTVTEVINDYKFTPSIEKFGDKVKITYTSICNEYPDNKLVKEFIIPIEEVTYVWDYLWYDDGLTLGYNQATETSKYTSFTATKSGDLSVGFISPLMSNNFLFQFNVDEGRDRFDYLLFELVDFIDSNKKLQIKVEKNDTSTSYVSYNGVKKLMTGGFGGTNAKLVLIYENDKLVDNLGNVVANFEDFDGFTSGQLWFKATMVNATTNASLKLVKLSTQALSATYRSQKLQAFNDTVAPSIILDNSIMPDAMIFEQIKLPKASAYNACSPCIDAYVTVTFVPIGGDMLQDSVTIINKQLADKETPLLLDKYGTYTVTYTAKNSANKVKNLPYNVFVNDLTKPVIYYTGETEISTSVNKTLNFAKPKVFDSVDKNPTLKIFMYTPDGRTNSLNGKLEYKFTEKGTYVLRFYVYDSNYNATSLDVRIKVK